MKTPLKMAFLFCAIFSEVHIKASTTESPTSVSHENGIELPDHCIAQKKLPCAIRSKVSRWEVLLGSVTAVLGDNTTVVWSGPGQYQIVEGKAWFYASEQTSQVHLKTEFGSIQSKSVFNVFVKKTPDLFEIYPVSNLVYVNPLGEELGTQLTLPAGYRSFLSRVTATGKAHYEIPVAANLKGFIESWAPLFTGTPQQLTSELVRYRKLWVEAVEVGASIHKGIAEREIASENQRQQRLVNLRKKQQEEEAQLKHLFRKKNYLD